MCTGPAAERTVDVGLFRNREEGRLRAGWRLLLQAALMVLLAVIPILLVAEPLTALHRRGLFLPGYNHAAYDRVINMIAGPLLTLAVIASVIVAARILDHRELADFGVRFDRVWWSSLGLGLSLGAVVMAIVFGIELHAGWIRITDTFAVGISGLSLALALSFSTVKVLCVGIYEELVTRGYVMRNLAEGTNLPTAVIASSAIFALLHFTNDNASILSALGLFVNGLFFATVLLVTGRLSAPIGLHIAWNFCEGVVFGFPVSGDKEAASFVAIQQGGPVLMTGGAFGPEAGIVGMAACVVGITILVLWRTVRVIWKRQPISIAKIRA